MNSNIMLFEQHQVEVLNLKGQALFNPYHVANILGIKNVRDNISNMNQKQVKKITNLDVGFADFRKLNNRGENFLTKSGVYKLIFKSHKPEAERFQDWVTDEVLPQIEKTGGYIPLSPADTEQDILAKAVLISQKTIENKDKIISNLETRIQDLEPKAQAYIDMMTAQGYLQFIDVAGMVEIGRNTLMQFLRKHKVLTKQSNFNIPYNRFRKNGYFKVICGKTEQGHVTSVTMVSPKGLDYIYKLIHKYNAENDFDTSKLLLQEVSA